MSMNRIIQTYDIKLFSPEIKTFRSMRLWRIIATFACRNKIKVKIKKTNPTYTHKAG
jgi:hypothetical protein